jgi:hypothetical protein
VDPRVRGTALLSNREFLTKRFGPEAFERVVATLPKQHADVVRVIPLAHEWYPGDAMVALLLACARVFSPDQPDAFYESLGSYNAEYDLNFIHRFLLRFTSPIWMMERGAKLWSDYHNTGEWTIEQGPTPHSLVGTLRDFALSGPVCRTVVGFVRRAGQMTGAKNMRVEHRKCCATGAKVCVFEGGW